MVTKGRAQSKKTRESLQNLIDVKFKNFLKLKILKILNFKIKIIITNLIRRSLIVIQPHYAPLKWANHTDI